MKQAAILLVLLNLSACTVFLGDPSERVVKFQDWELCTEMADKTFKYHPEWAWAIADEIKKRQLDSNERCEQIYNSRMERLLRKLKAQPVSFSDALNTGTTKKP